MAFHFSQEFCGSSHCSKCSTCESCCCHNQASWINWPGWTLIRAVNFSPSSWSYSERGRGAGGGGAGGRRAGGRGAVPSQVAVSLLQRTAVYIGALSSALQWDQYNVGKHTHSPSMTHPQLWSGPLPLSLSTKIIITHYEHFYRLEFKMLSSFTLNCQIIVILMN